MGGDETSESSLKSCQKELRVAYKHVWIVRWHEDYYKP